MRPTDRTAVVADPYPLWRDALTVLLDQLEVTVVGRTEDAVEAAALLDQHRPDLLVADVSLAMGNGHALLPRARAANPVVRCLVLSDRSNDSERDSVFAAGASAYCAKQAEPADLAATVRQLFSPSIYFNDIDAPLSLQPRTQAAEESLLTKREAEVLRLAAEGHSNSELASMLWVTEQTVKFHLSNIYRKLAVSNRTEASRWAQVHGLLQAEAPTNAAPVELST